jgi:hypothetical protein
LWTFTLMLWNSWVRVQTIRQEQLTLMEFPPLFYIMVLAIMLTERTDGGFIGLTWAYVGLRLGHSLKSVLTDRILTG